jgi:hypothetical protein
VKYVGSSVGSDGEVIMRRSFLALGATVALLLGGQLVQADDGDDKGPIFCAT